MGNVFIRIGPTALVVWGVLGGFALGGTPRALADAWSPGVTVGMRVDNPDAVAFGSGGEWIADVTPQLLLERLGPFTTWDIRAERRFDTRQRSGALRENQDVASARINSELTEHTTASLEGWYFHSRDLLNPDPAAQLTPSTMSSAFGSAALEFWRGEAGYQVEAMSHTAPELADGRSQSWNAALFPFRSEQTRWVIGWHREEWAVQGNTELATSVGTLGVRRQHTPGLASEFDLGVARVADDLQASRREDLALVAGLDGFGQALGLPFDARVRIEHDVETTGLAEIWRPMAGARIGLKWERTLHAVGGVIQGVARRDFVTLGTQDTLAGRSIVSLEGSYRLVTPRIGTGDQLETYRAMATITRDLRPWLRGRVRYSVAHQVGSGAIAGSDFDSDRVEMSLTAVYQ